MTNYTKTTDFAAKDALPSGNSAKIVKGSEIDTEFNNIATASATKANANSAALTGTTTFETISDGTIAITAFVDEDNMASDSATLLPTQQSVKAYVDSQVTAQDLDVTDGSTSIDIDLDSESLGILGGTGIDSTASGTGVTLAIDSTVATLTGSQTLTNKTLSAPVVSGNLTTDGLLDGRDVAADGSKLDGIEASADVTDTANVTAAGALMDSELTSEASVKALNQGVATTDSPTFAGLTTTADVSFGDNDKAVFGTGSDLEIFHDGSNSYVKEKGNGVLNISGGNAINFLTGNDAAETGLTIATDGAVTAYYDNAAKLATTSTGINVTGSISADGLTVDSAFEISGASPKIFLSETDTTDVNTRIRNAGGKLQIQTVDDSDSSPVTRFQIENSTGDISFYNSAGTSQSLFWDASAESLGLGTTSPAFAAGAGLEIEKAGTATLRLQDTTNTANGEIRSGPSGIEFFSGAYGTSGDPFSFSVSGTTALTIDSSRNVGIGTSSPDTQLEVSNAASAVLRLSTSDTSVAENQELGALEYSQADISGAGGGVKASIRAKADNSTAAQTYLAFHTSDSSANDVERMRIDSAGRVGIGASSPNYQLHLEGQSAATIQIKSSSDTGTSSVYFGDPTQNTPGFVQYVHTDDAMRFGAGNSERMRIDASGNVGIGVSSLVTGSSRRVLQVSTGSDGGQIAFADSTTEAANPRIFATNKSDLKLSSANSGSSTIQFITGTTPAERMRIDSSGRVGIGCTPSRNLDIQGTGDTLVSIVSPAANQVALFFGDTDSDSVGRVAYDNGDNSMRFTTNGSEAMRIDSSQNLLVGTTTSYGKLTVDGDTRLKFTYPIADNSYDLGTSSFRWDDVFATNGTIQTSDRNEKQDIEALSDAEQRVAVAAKGLLRKFRWKDSVAEKGDEARIHFGIIAQDLQAAFEAEGLDAGRYAMFTSNTWTDEDGNEQTRLGVRYSELLAFIISAI